jgi:hypothetical protein
MGWGEAHGPSIHQLTLEPGAEQRFREFHARNPAVYDALVAHARQLRQRGYQRCGLRMLWEVLRWESMLAVHGRDDGYRLNDHLIPHYARLIMDQELDLAGMFETRGLRAD